MTAFITFNALAGEDRTYDQYAREAIKATQKILINSGKCIDENDCTRNQHVFFSPISNGIEFKFYGITEEPLIKQLFAMLAQQYYQLPNGSNLHARFVSTTKEVDLKRSIFKSPQIFTEIHMKGQHMPNE